MSDPLAVTRRMPELEEDAGAGNTVTENLEFTKKFLEERESLRYRRVDEVPAGRKNVSGPTRSRVACNSGLCLVEPACCGDRDLWWQ